MPYLRTIRLARGWTQQELANKTKPRVRQNAISKLETAAMRRPTYQTVLALARALNIPVESLKFGLDPGSLRDGRRGPRRARRRPHDGGRS